MIHKRNVLYSKQCNTKNCEHNYNNLLPECISLLYLRNDSIHEHNTRGCHQLRVHHGAKTFSYISARIWNVLTNKFNCDVSMSIFKCKLKLFLLHNELVLNYPK